MPSELLTERQAGTLVLTLSDPATRNALSPQVYAAGIEALGVAASDPDVRAVVLRGDGANFCSGGNLQRIAGVRAAGELEGRPAQGEAIDRFAALVEELRSFPKPVIAAVEGHAAGGGFALALACDLIVAADDARFAMSYGRVGLSPDGGASWQLARRLPRPLALRLLWLAESLGAAQLFEWGLVHAVVPPGQATAEALQLAARLARMAPNALASAKALVDAAGECGLSAQLAEEREHFLDNLFHDNAGEGLAAFAEKRPPQFR